MAPAAPPTPLTTPPSVMAAATASRAEWPGHVHDSRSWRLVTTLFQQSRHSAWPHDRLAMASTVADVSGEVKKSERGTLVWVLLEGWGLGARRRLDGDLPRPLGAALADLPLAALLLLAPALGSVSAAACALARAAALPPGVACTGAVSALPPLATLPFAPFVPSRPSRPSSPRPPRACTLRLKAALSLVHSSAASGLRPCAQSGSRNSCTTASASDVSVYEGRQPSAVRMGMHMLPVTGSMLGWKAPACRHSRVGCEKG